MRKHLLVILAISAIIHSCKNHPQGDCCAESDTLEYIKEQGGGNVIDAGLLKGTWKDAADSTVALTIRDSVQYSQSPGVSYSYSIKNDSLFVSIEAIPFSTKIIKVTNDSLILENKGLVTRYAKTGQ